MTKEEYEDLGASNLLSSGVTDEDHNYSLACLQAVQRFGYGPVEEVLAACEDPEYPHRPAAIAAAAHLGEPDTTLPVLIRIYERELSLRSKVLAALAQMGTDAKPALPILYADYDPELIYPNVELLETILQIDPSNTAARRVMKIYSEMLAALGPSGPCGSQHLRVLTRLEKHGPRAESAVPAIVE